VTNASSRHSHTGERKALGGFEVVGDPATEASHSSTQSERPTVEGTSGAVELVTFREETGETALHGSSGESSAS
jgi:hypothetical protein